MKQVEVATTCEVELEFMRVCKERHIKYTRPEREGGRLDFHLTDYDMYVEVKTYSSPRLHDQLESVNAGPTAVMVLIGLSAVKAFHRMLKSGIQ